jgi:hypothetical protein
MTKRINKHVDELNINGLKVIYCFDDIMQTKPPVAGWDSRGAFRSNKRYSEFTESMINAYLGGEDVGTCSESCEIFEMEDSKQ